MLKSNDEHESDFVDRDTECAECGELKWDFFCPHCGLPICERCYGVHVEECLNDIIQRKARCREEMDGVTVVPGPVVDWIAETPEGKMERATAECLDCEFAYGGPHCFGCENYGRNIHG